MPVGAVKLKVMEPFSPSAHVPPNELPALCFLKLRKKLDSKARHIRFQEGGRSNSSTFSFSSLPFVSTTEANEGNETGNERSSISATRLVPPCLFVSSGVSRRAPQGRLLWNPALDLRDSSVSAGNRLGIGDRGPAHMPRRETPSFTCGRIKAAKRQHARSRIRRACGSVRPTQGFRSLVDMFPPR